MIMFIETLYINFASLSFSCSLELIQPAAVFQLDLVPGFEVSHGLVVSGANVYDTPTDLRVLVPDLGRNQMMVSSSCRLHMLYAKDGYAFFHTRCV